MAAFSLTSATVLIGTTWTGTAPGDPGTQTVSGTITTSTNISTMLTQVDVGLTVAQLEITNFGSGGWKQNTVGLKEGTLQLNFNQDFTASQIDALFGIGGSAIPFGGSGTYYVDVKPTSSARSTTNPSYCFQVYNTQYQPISGQVGSLAVGQLQLTITGQIARLTA
jgi:hypothetical protein